MASKSLGEKVTNAIGAIMVLAVIFSLLLLPYYLARAFYRRCQLNLKIGIALYLVWTAIGIEYMKRLVNSTVVSLSADYILTVWLVEELVFLVSMVYAGIRKYDRVNQGTSWIRYHQALAGRDNTYFIITVLPIFIFASLNLWYPNSSNGWVEAGWYLSLIWSVIGLLIGTLMMVAGTEHPKEAEGDVQDDQNRELNS